MQLKNQLSLTTAQQSYHCVLLSLPLSLCLSLSLSLSLSLFIYLFIVYSSLFMYYFTPAFLFWLGGHVKCIVYHSRCSLSLYGYSVLYSFPSHFFPFHTPPSRGFPYLLCVSVAQKIWSLWIPRSVAWVPSQHLPILTHKFVPLPDWIRQFERPRRARAEEVQGKML